MPRCIRKRIYLGKRIIKMVVFKITVTIAGAGFTLV